jgi:transaldolase
MKPTRQLHDLHQSLWLDNITRYLVSSRTVKHCMDELSVIYPTTAIRVVRQEE